MNPILISLLTAITFGCLWINNCMAQLPVTAYPPPPGITVNQARMFDMQFDGPGNLWVCFGNYGLGRYDTAWTLFNTLNSTLPSDTVNCISFDNTTNAWIGTKSGAAYLSGGNFTVYHTLNSGLPNNNVTAIHRSGSITWFGTDGGLARYDGNNWTIYDTGNSGIVNDSVTCIAQSGNGTLYVGTKNGLSKFDGTTWVNYTTISSQLNRHIIDIKCDFLDRVWISSGVIGFPFQFVTTAVHFFDNNVLKNFQTDLYYFDQPLTYHNGTNFTIDNTGRLAFRVTLNGVTSLFLIEGGNIECYTIPNINQGVPVFGSLIEFDQNNQLAIVPRFRFYLYFANLAGYVPQLGGSTLHNFRYLDGNDVRAGINVGGDMHWDYTNPKYEVPKGSGKHSVFASSFWIGGLDQGGQLRVAAQTYRQTGNDFWPGPIGGINVSFDSTSCVAFDRIWKIDRWKIEEFKNNFIAGNVTNGIYPVPEELSSWPAKGNGVVVTEMAPFVDFNNDGMYNPVNGDYPLIKGDQMLFWIFNDSLSIHTESGGMKLGAEIHASAYIYSCPNIPDSNQVLNRTTFYNYTIINRSPNNYNNVYLGLYSDTDLGNWIDDQVGCDSVLHAGYTYNGDNDDDVQFGGYGLNPPMQNIKILRGTLADPFDNLDNNLNGIVDEPGERTTMNHFQYYDNVFNTPTSYPLSPLEFYQYMQSIWRDGTHVTYGGNGHNSSASPTNFMYSGNPYTGAGWSAPFANIVPADRRMLLGSGPFSLNSGDTATIDFAYVFTWDPTAPNGANTSFARNIADLQRVQYWFDNNNFPSCQVYTTGVDELTSAQLKIFPNPADDRIQVFTTGREIKNAKFEILNLVGDVVLRGSMNSNQIYLTKIPPQVYMLRIVSEGNVYNGRFVKM
jgi:hypothetical protein